MKEVKVEEKNKSAIVDAINAVEGKSSVNLLSYAEIVQLAAHAEKRMKEMGIIIKSRAGAEFHYQPEGPSANSYKYAQGATAVRIIRKSTGWFVKKIERTSAYPKQKEIMCLMLTEVQKDIAVRDFCSSFVTMRKPVAIPELPVEGK